MSTQSTLALLLLSSSHFHVSRSSQGGFQPEAPCPKTRIFETSNRSWLDLPGTTEAPESKNALRHQSPVAQPPVLSFKRGSKEPTCSLRLLTKARPIAWVDRLISSSTCPGRSRNCRIAAPQKRRVSRGTNGTIADFWKLVTNHHT